MSFPLAQGPCEGRRGVSAPAVSHTLGASNDTEAPEEPRTWGGDQIRTQALELGHDSDSRSSESRQLEFTQACFLICEMGAIKTDTSKNKSTNTSTHCGGGTDTHRMSPTHTPGLELSAEDMLLLNPSVRGGPCYCALVTNEETEAQSKLSVVSYSCAQQ